MKFDEKFVESVTSLVNELLESHLVSLEEAWNSSEEDLNVSFSVQLKPAAEGALEAQVTMSFVKGRVKERISSLIEDPQQRLFPEDDESPPRG